MKPFKNGRFDKNKASIAVIGGGIRGIAAALELAETGLFEVTLYEKQDRLGGLSSTFRWQDINIDRFYHVILPRDMQLQGFINKLGLESEMFWAETRTGFFGDQKLVSLSSLPEFIRFPFLSFFQKLRLGLGLIYSSKIKMNSELAAQSAPDWLKRIFGEKVYSRIWKPLLLSKLGGAIEKTSAVFIWATISRLYGARDTSQKKEKMGQVHGGYDRVLKAAEKRLAEHHVSIRTGDEVQKIEKTDNEKWQVKTGTEDKVFDLVLLTLPSPESKKLLKPDLNSDYWNKFSRVEYLGVICVLMVLKHQLSPYYVINLLDEELPFTGIVETTNVIPAADLGGHYLVYLPKYAMQDDPVFSMPDADVTAMFQRGLKKVFPDLNDNDIVHTRIFKEKNVQPILELNYLDRVIGFSSPDKNLYIADSSMVYENLLNNDTAVQAAVRCVEEIASNVQMIPQVAAG